MFDKLKIALVLVVIGAMSGLTIYSVNLLTKDTIAQNIIEKEQGFYKELFYLDETVEVTYDTVDFEDENIVQEVTLYDSMGDVVGYIYKGTEKNNYGDVTVLIGISANGDISNVVISSTTNTPTFVKVIKRDYLTPFGSQTVDNISLDSNTGATYTYTSVANIVQNAATYFLENRGEQND
jgi:Na+-translocating ferredoxin:NAD+ oxidoreductase RnfG subunit